MTTPDPSAIFIGRWSLAAFLSVVISVPLLIILTAVSCWWDFEYERCAVEPLSNVPLEKKHVQLPSLTKVDSELQLDKTQLDSSIEERQIKKRAAMTKAANTISASHSERASARTQSSLEQEDSTQSLSKKANVGRLSPIKEESVEKDVSATQVSPVINKKGN
uniref:Uncharacterized protein n=1 Tax=Panagrolaimus sp. JU765 TaxID=591449 RepID=A0AC34QF73_9BILA